MPSLPPQLAQFLEANMVTLSLPLKYPEPYSITFTPEMPGPITIHILSSESHEQPQPATDSEEPAKSSKRNLKKRPQSCMFCDLPVPVKFLAY
jgi:hypothetical protein